MDHEGNVSLTVQRKRQLVQRSPPCGVALFQAAGGQHSSLDGGLTVQLIPALYVAVQRFFQRGGVCPHALQHLGDGQLVSTFKIEAPAPMEGCIGTAVITADHKADAVVVPACVPVHFNAEIPHGRVGCRRAVRVLLHIVFVELGNLGVDAGSVRAVAFQPGQMDVQPDLAAVFRLHHLFKGVLLGDHHGGVHGIRRGRFQLPAASRAGRGCGLCPAACQQRRQQNCRYPAECFVFHGGSPVFSAAPAGVNNPGSGSAAAGSFLRQRGSARRSW